MKGNMMRSIREEFIGQDVEIVKSNDSCLLGLKGYIVDETKNTFKIASVNSKLLIVLKNCCSFKIGGTLFEGARLMKRPEDRIKLKV